ncbi:hypothetical protein [Vibrio sp. PNB23_22_7]
MIQNLLTESSLVEGAILNQRFVDERFLVSLGLAGMTLFTVKIAAVK